MYVLFQLTYIFQNQLSPNQTEVELFFYHSYFILTNIQMRRTSCYEIYQWPSVRYEKSLECLISKLSVSNLTLT